MIKPPKTAVLAAMVAAGIGCKGKDPVPTQGRVGTVAEPLPNDEPARAEPQDGDAAAPEPDAPGKVPPSTKVGTTAKPQGGRPQKVGRVATPDRRERLTAEQLEARNAVDDPPKEPAGEETPPALPRPVPPKGEPEK